MSGAVVEWADGHLKSNRQAGVIGAPRGAPARWHGLDQPGAAMACDSCLPGP